MSNCATYRCMITIALGGLIRANSEPASVGIHCKLIAIYIDRGCDRRDAKYKATRERKMTWCRRCVRAIMRSRGRSSKPPVATSCHGVDSPGRRDGGRVKPRDSRSLISSRVRGFIKISVYSVIGFAAAKHAPANAITRSMATIGCEPSPSC